MLAEGTTRGGPAAKAISAPEKKLVITPPASTDDVTDAGKSKIYRCGETW